MDNLARSLRGMAFFAAVLVMGYAGGWIGSDRYAGWYEEQSRAMAGMSIAGPALPNGGMVFAAATPGNVGNGAWNPGGAGGVAVQSVAAVGNLRITNTDPFNVIISDNTNNPTYAGIVAVGGLNSSGDLAAVNVNLSGSVNGFGANISGVVNDQGEVSTGQIAAPTAAFSGQVSAGSLSVAGGIVSAGETASGPISGTTGSFPTSLAAGPTTLTGSLTGTSGAFSAGLTAQTLGLSALLTGVNASFSSNVTSLGVGTFNSIVIPGQFAIALTYNPGGGGNFDQITAAAPSGAKITNVNSSSGQTSPIMEWVDGTISGTNGPEAAEIDKNGTLYVARILTVDPTPTANPTPAPGVSPTPTPMPSPPGNVNFYADLRMWGHFVSRCGNSGISSGGFNCYQPWFYATATVAGGLTQTFAIPGTDVDALPSVPGCQATDNGPHTDPSPAPTPTPDGPFYAQVKNTTFTTVTLKFNAVNHNDWFVTCAALPTPVP